MNEDVNALSVKFVDIKRVWPKELEISVSSNPSDKWKLNIQW